MNFKTAPVLILSVSAGATSLDFYLFLPCMRDGFCFVICVYLGPNPSLSQPPLCFLLSTHHGSLVIDFVSLGLPFPQLTYPPVSRQDECETPPWSCMSTFTC